MRAMCLAALGVALMGFPLLALADSKVLGRYSDWLAYDYESGGARGCAISSAPVEKGRGSARRGATLFIVTLRAGKSEVSVRAGYPFSVESKPFAQVEGRVYHFYTGANRAGEDIYWAWLVDPSKTDDLVKDMKKYNFLTFKGRAKEGKVLTDTYSLRGFTASMAKIQEACR